MSIENNEVSNSPSNKSVDVELFSELGTSFINSDSGSNPKLMIYTWPIDSSSKYIVAKSVLQFIGRSLEDFIAEFPIITSRIVEDEQEIKHMKSLFSNLSEDADFNVFFCLQIEPLISSHFSDRIETFRTILGESTMPTLVECNLDKRRIAEMRRRAVKSAVEWNNEINKERKIERNKFFEHQTMLIHYPNRKSKNDNVETNFGLYPVALMSGQYQNFYKNFTTTELNRLPINTVIDTDVYRPIGDCPSPEAIVVSEADLLVIDPYSVECDEEISKDKNIDRRCSKSSVSLQGTVDRISVDTQNEVSRQCAFCCEDIGFADKWAQCSKCSSLAHKSCLDMSDTMYQVVKSYSWMCIECKPCSICSKLDEEDKMLFCDRCDRGYHTFCVGLNRLPSGRWICQKFCAVTSDQQNTIMLNFSCLNNNDDNSNCSSNRKNSISKKSNCCVKCGCCMDGGDKNTSRMTRKKKKAQICDVCRSNESKKPKVEVKVE